MGQALYKDEKKKLEFLRNAALELVELPVESNLYQFAADKLHSICNEAHIVINSCNSISNQITIEAYSSKSGIAEQAMDILGRRLKGMSLPHYKNYEILLSGELEVINNGLYELTSRQIPRTICNALEKFLRISKYYTIGFVRKNQLFGNALIIASKGMDFPDKSFVEAFIHQISIAFHKRKAEQALIESEEKFRKAFETSTDAVNINRWHDGLYLDTNQGFMNLTGYRREEIIGKTSGELEVWADHEDRYRLMEELEKQGYVNNMEFSFRMKNGKIRKGLMSANILTLEGKKYILSVTRDITERAEKNEEITIQKKYFEDLFHYSPDAIVILDENDCILEANRNFTRLFEYSLEEVKGQPINNLIVPDNLKDEGFRATSAVGHGSFVDFETVRLTKTGKIIPVSVRGKPIMLGDNKLAVYGIYRDQTKSIEAEEELKQSEERYRIVSTQTGQIIYDYDINSGNISWAGAIEEVLGYSPEEFQKVGIQEWEKMVHPDDISSTLKILEQAKKNKARFHHEYRFRKKDGTYIYMEENGIFQKKPDGISYRMLGSMKDVNESKLYQNKLEKARLKAEESDRLKTAFLANMSHEIRTPMNAIIGFSSLLENSSISKSDQSEYIQLIKQSCQNLMGVIDDIIDISMIETKQLTLYKRSFCVSELLDELYSTYKEYRKLVEKGHLDFDLSETPDQSHDKISSDPERIKQILSNLLGNAIKYTKKGFVKFGAKNLQKNGQPFIEFYVIDSGIGIPKDKQDIIFERFRQVDDSNTRKTGGTGLGLAISRQIAELLGGKITVHSEPDNGSVFYFTIPVEIKASLKKEDNNMHSIQNDKMNKQTILVVEDVESNYLLVESILSKKGLNLIHAQNGKEAVDAFKNNSGIDLILMDMRMPGMDGYEATKLIRGHDNKIPIIALTAYAMKSDIEKSLKSGCNDHLSKPIMPKTLLGTINKYLKNAQI